MSLIISLLVGAIVGLLINYFSDVLPATRRITRPLCNECQKPYTVKEYLINPKCSGCGKKTPPRFFIVLFGAVIASILLHFFPFRGLSYLAAIPILIFLGVIMVIDIEHHLVLYETSLFGFVLFFIYGLILQGFLNTLKGAIVGFLIMFLFFITGVIFSKIVSKLRHSEMNEVAFGFGDVCAGTFLGLLTGYPLIIGSIVIAILAFGAVAVVLLVGLLVTKRYRAFSNAQPFAPYLILGVIVILYL